MFQALPWALEIQEQDGHLTLVQPTFQQGELGNKSLCTKEASLTLTQSLVYSRCSIMAVEGIGDLGLELAVVMDRGG